MCGSLRDREGLWGKGEDQIRRAFGGSLVGLNEGFQAVIASATCCGGVLEPSQAGQDSKCLLHFERELKSVLMSDEFFFR